MNSQLDILFVNTNSSHTTYQGLADKWVAIEPPTWSLLLAQACRAKNYSVGILDAHAENLTHEQTASRILEIEPTYVCFVSYGQNPNSSSCSMMGVYEVAKMIKEGSKLGIETISIGNHTAALPTEVLSNKYIDNICLNEGVYTLLELLDGCESSKNPGLGWKDHNNIIHINSGIGSIVPNERMDIDMPGYAWDLLPYKEKPFDLYRAHLWHAEYQDKYRTPFAALYTSLGCKFKCLRGNTIIHTIYGDIPIKDIANQYKEIGVYTYDRNKKKSVIAKAINIQKTDSNRKLVRVIFDDNTYIDCTPDHKFLTFKNSNQSTPIREYEIEAQYLIPKTRVRAIRFYKDGKTIGQKSRLTKTPNHKVKEVIWLDETDDVYCMEVPGYDWFYANNVLVHNCNFCMINTINRTDTANHITAADSNIMRFWSPEFIIKEFEKLINNYGISTVRVVDEMFFLNKKYYEPLLTMLKDRGYGKHIKMWTYARVDTVNERFLDLFRAGGVKWLALGIEAANQEIRKEIYKGKFQDINIRDVVKQIQDHDMYVGGNYIFGHSTEKEEHMQETLDLALELNTELGNFHPAMALPGSPLYYEAKKRGAKFPEKLSGYSFFSYDCQPSGSTNTSPAEVLAFRDKAWKIYHESPKFLSMIESKFGVDAKNNIVEMSKIKLKRQLLGD